MKKINNCKDLFCDIRKKNRRYFDRIKKDGGYSLYFRAIAAQILWLTLLYNIGMLLIPAKDYLLAHSILVYILISILLINTAAGNKILGEIKHYATGDFFHKFEINFLNRSILLLLLFSCIFIFLNSNNLNNFKLHARRK